MNRRRLHVRFAVATLASAMLLTACGSDSDGGGGSGSEAKADQAAAKAFIEPYEKEPSPFPVTSELAESPAGKKVAFMDVGTPTSALIHQLMAPAAEALGIELTRIDTGQSADTVETGFGTAESGGFDGVVVASLPPSLWERHLDALTADGVAVITTGVTGVSADKVPVRIASEVSSEFNAELLAAYAVNDKGADLNAVFYTTPEIQFTELMADAFEKKVDELCEGCTVRVEEIPATAVGTTAPQLVTDGLQANPDTNAAVFAVGEQATGLSAAMKVAGLETDVITGPPTPETLQQIKDGGIKAALGYDLAILGWTAVDSISRIMTGQEPDEGAVEDQIPYQFLTKDNLPEDISHGWSAYPDFPDRFMKLWQPALS